MNIGYPEDEVVTEIPFDGDRNFWRRLLGELERSRPTDCRTNKGPLLALADAKLKPSDLDEIICWRRDPDAAGGRFVAELLAANRTSRKNPDEAVAVGARFKGILSGVPIVLRCYATLAGIDFWTDERDHSAQFDDSDERAKHLQPPCITNSMSISIARRARDGA